MEFSSTSKLKDNNSSIKNIPSDDDDQEEESFNRRSNAICIESK